MATKKPVKKAVAKVTKPVKKAAKKVVKKTTVAKKRVSRAVSRKPKQMESFKVYRDQPPFKSFKVTRQTIYWTILLAFIMVTQLWILKIQLEIAELTNSLLVI